MKRLFLALPVPSADVRKMANFTEIYKKDQHLENARWIDPEHFHITVLFLGDVMDSELSTIQNILQGVTSRITPFELYFEHVEFFPYKVPRMIWGRYQRSLAFDELHRECRRFLLPYLQLEEGELEYEKELIPHLTLARLRNAINPKRFSFQAFDLPPLQVTELHLYESELRPEGPAYTLIKTFPYAI